MKEKSSVQNMLSMISNITLIVVASLMVLGVWLQYENYVNVIAYACITMSVIGIVVSVLETKKPIEVFKQLNIYAFLVVIVIAISIILSSRILLYIGLALFGLTLILFMVPIVGEKLSKNKEDGKSKKK